MRFAGPPKNAAEAQKRKEITDRWMLANKIGPYQYLHGDPPRIADFGVNRNPKNKYTPMPIIKPSKPRNSDRGGKPKLIIKKYGKGFHGIVKKPTYMLVGEAGPEDVDVTPLKKFTPKTKNLPKFKTNDSSDYPKLGMQKSFPKKVNKVNIVKNLPKTNISYPKMTDIFDMPKDKGMKMPKNNYSMGMPQGKDVFGITGKSKPFNKSKNSIFPEMTDIFDMPKADSKGFNFGVAKNIFSIDDSSFDGTSRKAKKFYGKVKEKKLDNLGGFGDWGKLDDKASKYDFGF